MILTHISCFSGIGGIDLAADWAGFTTIAQIEKDPYCRKILEKHWPDIPKYEDIKDVSKNTFVGGHITFPTLLSGGFPCQPFSTAGKRKGKEDDRFLWPEMYRLVQEFRPTWVIGENVTGIVSMGIDIPIIDLENKGYKVRAFIFPAFAVGAPHRRDRVFIVAHSGYNARSPKQRRKQDISKKSDRSSTGRVLSNPNCKCSKWKWADLSEKGQKNEGGSSGLCCREWGGQWQIEPRVGRVAYGVSHRVDRIRALGNAVVPQQIYPILKGIADIERGGLQCPQ